LDPSVGGPLSGDFDGNVGDVDSDCVCSYALIDSYVYGFALQESALPFEGPETVAEVAEPMMEKFSPGEYPHLVEMATEYFLQPGYDFGDEFEFGLGMILDALTRSIPGKGSERRS
jgi:hypothetical protein